MGLLSPSKIKCPKCGYIFEKKVMLYNDGKCQKCGYKIATSINSFFKS